MTATIDDVTADDAPAVSESRELETPSGFGLPHQAGSRAMIAVELLTAHPGNVRRDVSLDQEFLDSIAELGILTPLRITPDGADGYRVIDGYALPVTVRLHVEHVTWQETSSLFT
jgi:hypothetical protein